jgi:tetratricopeptide (TPR) repeat protein
MFRKLTAAALPLLLAGLATQAAVGQSQFDRVFLPKVAAPSQGIITEMGRDKIKLDMSGVAREFQVNEIARISYAEEPVELNTARGHVLQKNYNAALTELKKLDAAPPARDVVKQDVDYFKALCMAKLAMSEGGDKAAAGTAMLNFVKSAPQNFHFYDAAEVMGDLAVATGNYADAVRYYTPIAAAPWGDVQMRANNAIGRALSAEKQFEPALAKFEAVLGSELASPEATQQKLQATVGKSICLAETGKADQGITALNDIIAKNDPQDTNLFARTYNALGRCYLKQNKPKDALLAFLHTDTLFYAEPESHAEALFYLSTLWNGVNKADRGVAARATLQQRYAGSIWNNPNRKP